MARLETLMLFVFICGNVSVVAVSHRFLPRQRRVTQMRQMLNTLSDSEFPEVKAPNELTLSELKRAFAILDKMDNKMSAPSQMSRNLELPVAWYEPHQDDAERSYDEGECVDKFPRCQKYADDYLCQEKKYQKWMKAKCRKTCDFCHCRETKYRCCPDGKTPAEGPAKAGCGVKLCIDFRSCEKYKASGDCDNPANAKEYKTWLRNNCARTCQYCKALSPKDDCLARQPVYGCCWNGDEATGWNNEGCLPCEDNYPRTCRLYKSHCDSPFYESQQFMETQCPMTCGKCGECLDKQDKCAEWEKQGYCNGRLQPAWKGYMAQNCAKTCGLCTVNESIGARSYLGEDFAKNSIPMQ